MQATRCRCSSIRIRTSACRPIRTYRSSWSVPARAWRRFRAFIEDREEIGAGGKTWLFFGDRRFRTDFLYQVEWLRWLKLGVLTRLDVAFSRDQGEKVYVQNRMAEKSREMYELAAGRRRFLRLRQRQPDGRRRTRMLLKIIQNEGGKTAEEAAAYVKSLREQGRYQTRRLLDAYHSHARHSLTKTPPAKKLSRKREHQDRPATSSAARSRKSLGNRITGSVPDADNALLKFHGTYMQDDRDIREERARQRLEPAFDFMVRIRAAGGIVTPQQWLDLDALAHKYANGQTPPHHAAVVPVPRRDQVEPPPDDPRHQPDAAGHARRLRRREPQRDVQPEPVRLGNPRRGLRMGQAA